MTTTSTKQVPRLDEMTRSELIQYLKDTVKPEEGLIPSYIFSHPKVYELEMEKIFLKDWLFVAHKSEIPNIGDFVTREMGGQSVIVTHGADGEIHVLLNVCTHRGMKLCRMDNGNQKNFTCPYHGFNFKNTGDLIGIPFQKVVYGETMDKSKMGLKEIRHDVYADLIFATLNSEAVSLEDFLGDIKWYLDLAFNRAEMEVVGLPQKWNVDGTWKLGSDNTISDSYHTLVSHGSIAKLGLVPTGDYSKYGYQIYTGNGHGLNLGMPNPDGFAFPESLIDEYKERLNEDQYDILKQMKNMIVCVSPNIMILISSMDLKGQKISHTSLRIWKPTGPDSMEISSWMLVEKNATEEWKRLSEQAFTLTFGASGIFEQDDTENFTDITQNSKSPYHLQENIVFNYTMGMHQKPVEDFVGPGIVYKDKFNEANSRAFFRNWLDQITAE
ncbi:MULTISPECIES: Rieske 2Fe-2S domain-containing protein [unclassified Sporosarcina]|uniref:aromatic ring-hydroxylating oxygenase subunit alpha n=1 Tax=unclassified Sporosarcina TaxID=2647733 RepID=UPI000C16A05F|nr:MULTISPECIES: aromatic ring-hydroxylating dioxygenase subunit alpha [unclassified Sporosarcina]PID14998.1 aromatic ring-hydroxylating dioxygenase subunit alpha [Sporosarcina sp. P34]PID25234.1 aromatic ring-hydroxylating dioxygenase subunit alpha [Sporosarcina sp. P7]